MAWYHVFVHVRPAFCIAVQQPGECQMRRHGLSKSGISRKEHPDVCTRSYAKQTLAPPNRYLQLPRVTFAPHVPTPPTLFMCSARLLRQGKGAAVYSSYDYDAPVARSPKNTNKALAALRHLRHRGHAHTVMVRVSSTVELPRLDSEQFTTAVQTKGSLMHHYIRVELCWGNPGEAAHHLTARHVHYRGVSRSLIPLASDNVNSRRSLGNWH